jgi:hypothetical protein
LILILIPTPLLAPCVALHGLPPLSWLLFVDAGWPDRQFALPWT